MKTVVFASVVLLFSGVAWAKDCACNPLKGDIDETTKVGKGSALMYAISKSHGGCAQGAFEHKPKKYLRSQYEVFVEYNGNYGFTEVDKGGIHWNWGGNKHSNHKFQYPKAFYGVGYPLYFIGKNLPSTTHVKRKQLSKKKLNKIKNLQKFQKKGLLNKKGKKLLSKLLRQKNRPMKNVRVDIVHEYLNKNCGDGVNMGGDSKRTFFVSKWHRGTEHALHFNYKIPGGSQAGLNQTHVIVAKCKGKVKVTKSGKVKDNCCRKTKVLFNDPYAGIFCPPD